MSQKMKSENVKTFDTADLKSGLRKFKELKNEKAQLEEEIKKLNARIDECQQKVYEIMTSTEMTKVTIDDTTFYTTARLFFSINPEQKTKALKWVRDNHPELLSVNAQTLTSFLTEYVKEQKKSVPSFFVQTTQERVGMRKINQKED